jgi:hypothetical protein
MCAHVPYFIILCLMPDYFTCQGESAAIHKWVNLLKGKGYIG